MDRPQITSRLKELLGRIVAENGGDPRRIDLCATFAELGVNSVDLLDFVLGLEDGFGVRVLDDMLPEDLPGTLDGWAEFLQTRLSEKAAA